MKLGRITSNPARMNGQPCISNLRLTELLIRVISECEEDWQQGAVVTVEASRIRVRRLPLLT